MENEQKFIKKVAQVEIAASGKIEIDLNDVRDVLLEFLEEEFLEESVIHKWFDKILDR